jgi:hypothetical protein
VHGRIHPGVRRRRPYMRSATSFEVCVPGVIRRPYDVPMSHADRARLAAAVKELRESIAARRRLPVESPAHGAMLAYQVELSAEIRRLAELVRRESAR